MYPRDRVGNTGKVTVLYTYYSILNRLFRKTLTPRDENPSDISVHAKNLMSRMQPDPRGGDFSVGDFIWEEIKHISETPLKTCGYAPYIMRVILKVTRRNFGMDVKHEPLRIKHPKHVRVPSDGRYDEVQVENQEDQEDRMTRVQMHSRPLRVCLSIRTQTEAMCLTRGEMHLLHADLLPLLDGCFGPLLA